MDSLRLKRHPEALPHQHPEVAIEENEVRRDGANGHGKRPGHTELAKAGA